MQRPVALLLAIGLAGTALSAPQKPPRPSATVSAAARVREKPIKRLTPGKGLSGGGTGPTVTVEIAPGGITGAHVQQGTLGAEHLSSVAREFLRGAVGPQGPAGPQGLKGDTG